VILFIGVTESVISPDGKAVLITGCDKGMGNRLAKELNQLGFKVYAAVRNTDSPGARGLKTNATHPEKMVVFKLDVTNDTQANEAYEMIKQDLTNTGYVLWALDNNAGVTEEFPLDWSTLDSYRRIFDVNLFGVIRMSRVFLPLLRVSKGRIINMVSIAGRIPFKNQGVYCMTKYAAMSFTDVLRQEVSRFGIKVISIEPQIVGTGMFTFEAQIRQLEKAWNQTSPEIREIYGDASAERDYLKTIYTLLQPASTERIVDDIIDAIVSCKPKANYRKYDIEFQLFYALNAYTPIEFRDWTLGLFAKMSPLLSMLK